ncbi:biopolymer transporter ExbD [Geothermobacter hydrogeniphilus]|uniref:Biopolymer transporter ExbD n=2 Tax=Geothermobacter hydrogeniphilus TaxID=1969733 RepID=A0A2K2H695_9BACT|nr:biopolymer transporter ExbD [Geothermobacter hydrogeniphilus]
MFSSRRGSEEPKVDMTPMVDVVFLLLIFFMISTTFVETPGIDVNLPKSSLEVTEKKPQEIKVFIDARGKIVIDEKQVSLKGLKDRLKAMGAKTAETTFVLMADRDVRHGRVVEVMDAAKEAGFEQLAIATEKTSR